jgi:hypothetical protein
MPAAINKRRKTAATNTKNASSLSKTRGIDTFTKVSKASTTSKDVVEKNSYVDAIATTELEEYGTKNGKRKLVIEEEEIATILTSITERIIKPLPQRLSNTNPRTPQKQITTTDSQSTELSTKSTRNLFDQLLSSSKHSVQTPSQVRAPTPLAASQDLPSELVDLINLHAAFLTALSLHYAHNGTHSPADLRILCPDVARAWGKRSVKIDDIRRTLGVLNTNTPPRKAHEKISRLSLSDYGLGKICIEIKSATGKAGRMARPVDENLLNGIYGRGLRKLWGEREECAMVGEFVKGLPMETITVCPSLAKMSPLLAKGQRRLEDMRAGITIRQEAKQKVQVVDTGPKQSLLERLRAKQLHQSTLPAPPSKAQLSRKAALQRIEEVASVLTILSTSTSIGQQRISFTLPTVLGKLRDSFKTPMSKEEGDTCVRLLASDVAPNWVKIVKMGKVEALVVNRDERPSELDIKERVKHAS